MRLTPFQLAWNLGAKDNELAKYPRVEYFTSEFAYDHPKYNIFIPSPYICTNKSPEPTPSTPPKNLRYAPKIPP